MIVVPTEKQFDWRHAPVVLFSIVLLNVMVFVFYQSGDTEKLYTAVGTYLETDYLPQEWPLFEQYITDHEGATRASELAELYTAGQHQPLAMAILRNPGFYQHLTTAAGTTFRRDFYEDWQYERPQIQAAFNEISWIAHGLIASDFKISALFTSQFLHGGVMHLLGNMFFLVICGFAVEAAIGHWRFLLFYLVCGVAAGMAQVMRDWTSTTPLVGASGAISGVMAMYLAVFRLRKIEFFYWIFFFVGYFRAPALVILPVYVGKELFSFYTNPDSNVAFLAHAGGFVAGGILIGLSLLLDKKTVNETYIESDQSTVDESRLALADIYKALEKYNFGETYKRVNQAIKDHGETFELAIIRYNLLKINRGKGFAQSVLRLWQLGKLSTQEVERLQTLWQEHPELHGNLKDEYAVNLGMKFASLQNPAAAEQVFDLLLQRGNKSQELFVFAKKLSQTFAQNGYKKKQAKYDNFIQQFVSGGHNGAL